MAEKLSWNQPCCERCWIERHGEWEFSPGAIGPWSALVAVRQPTVVRNPGLNRCAFCGAMTIMGIFVRFNPVEVRFPAKEDDDA